MNPLIGTWKMIHTERINADGRLVARPYGEKGMGLHSLNEDGRMICVLCEGTENPASSELREYNSYCGSYHYDGKQLTTRVDACSNPQWMGTDQIRGVSFDNNILVLRPAEGTGPVSDGQRVLHWTKLADSKV